MPLAYYSRAATTEFWTEHWGGQSLDELLRIARSSPLTELIERHLPATGRVLEAGCGLGQYVLLLRERGRAVVGADWSGEPLKAAAAAGAPLVVTDLRTLAVRTAALAAYLSLGVVEHDPAGPGAIVAEAARVLAPGGVLLLSVPYWNGLRRLGTPYLTWRSARLRRAGADFYQFAFTRREVRAFVEGAGLRVRSLHPYDPARLLRKAVGAWFRPCAADGPRRRPPDPALPRPGRGGRAKAGVRRLLYTEPALRCLGHMILAVAVKPSPSLTS